jgi:hypothetical protein
MIIKVVFFWSSIVPTTHSGFSGILGVNDNSVLGVK